MSDLLQKIKQWYESAKTKRLSYEKPGVNPAKDWRFFLSTTFIVGCVLAIVTAYFYMQIDKGRLFTVDSDGTETQVKINNFMLKKTVDEINSRETSMTRIKDGKVSLPDPSL